MKEIPGYEGLYAACEDGTILSLQTTRTRRAGPLKPYRNTGGYFRVNLYKDGKVRHEYVHRLVARTFLQNPEKLPVVNHINANPADNSATNLEWCDQRHNIAVSREAGRQKKDRAVRATSTTTGEVRAYRNMSDAGLDLFGKYYALRWHHQRKGGRFILGGWLIEVAG